jgi:hypothetical protein
MRIRQENQNAKNQTGTCLGHGGKDMASHGILQHEGMRQIVDVLARTGKVCELQNLHTSGQKSAMSYSATSGERMDILSPFEGL